MKDPTFRSGFVKNQFREGDCLKRGLGQFADLRGGGLGKKEGVDMFKLQ